MTITVSHRVKGDDYFLDGEDRKLLEFSSVKEAINYLADHNYTITNLRDLDFNIEEEA
jgi:hypothetical protein